MNRLLIAGVGLLGFCAANADDLGYSPDGGLVSFGEFDYVYDSASRLTEVWSNGAKVVENQYDALGRRVMQYVDKQGTIVASYAYDAFGNITQKCGVKADELKMRFSTKYSDDESGLYYFGRRFYSPRLARWLSRDPIEEEGGLNLYVYCGNDSMNNVDPYGLVLLKVLTTQYGVEKPVRNIYDIFVVPLASKTLNGVFCSWVDVDPCEIRLMMQIQLNERLVVKGNPNIIHYFEPHDIYGGRGGTKSFDGSPEIRGGILAHERGHASSFLHAFLPAFRRRIAKFGNKRLSRSEQEEVRRIYQSCIEEFQPDNAARANQAQIDWYKNNGYRLERRKR